jgi:hypothetical protein
VMSAMVETRGRGQQRTEATEVEVECEV